MGQIIYHCLVIGGCLLGALLLVALILVGLAVWLGGSEAKSRGRRG